MHRFIVQQTYSLTLNRTMINRFVLNEVSYFGPGAREVLPQEIKRLGLNKAFVATDKDLLKFGVADKVLKVLEGAGIPYVVFSEIKPNPTVSNVNAGVKAFAESGADFILAIGGGSSIDTSKAIGIITNNPEFADVVSLEGVAPTKKKSVPIIALPTTAGTAAEVTINYVITDEVNEKKMVCVDPNDIPAIAIVDAELELDGPDFRTTEKFAQLLFGLRGHLSGLKNGRLIIQTADEQGYDYEPLLTNDYAACADTEMMLRESFTYPPFVHLLRVTLKAKETDLLNAETHRLKQTCKNWATEILGPVWCAKKTDTLKNILAMFTKQIILCLIFHTYSHLILALNNLILQEILKF